MAECSYSRCVQERRNIRRELQKWTKNMVYVVGLERVAEELMGRRKWKLYQESITKSLSGNNNNNNIIQQQSQIDCRNLNTATSTTINNNNKINNITTTTLLSTIENNNEERTSPSSISATTTSSTTTTTSTSTAAVQEAEGGTFGVSVGCNKLEERLRFGTTTGGGGSSDTTATTVIVTQPDGEIVQVRDWSPNDKCLFCTDGKLESHDSDTLLPASSLGRAGSTLSPHPTDSDTSESHTDSETPPTNPLPTLAPTLSPSAVAQLLHHHNNNNPNAAANMATIESVHSMAASLAAVAALSNNATAMGQNHPALPFYQPGMFSHQWLHLSNITRHLASTHSERMELNIPSIVPTVNACSTNAVLSSSNPVITTEKMQSSLHSSASTEQPLDLSSKSGGSSTSSLLTNCTAAPVPTATSALENVLQLDPIKMQQNLQRVPSMDTKQIYKAKPRMTAMAGRRTYTEEELQAALRDIQSGKLGTRRAAVIYGIPRSTLRNKVYKLAMERERESHLVLPSSTPTVKLEEEEDDKELSGAEEEKEVEKVLQKPLLSMDDILRFSNLEPNSLDNLKHLLQKEIKDKHEIWAGLEHSNVGPVIQSLLAATSTLLPDQKNEEISALLPELVRSMIAEEHNLRESSMKFDQNGTSEKNLSRQSSASSVIIRNDRIFPNKSGTPDVVETETNDSLTQPHASTDSPSNVILKIPSFKPTTSKNGGDFFKQNPVGADQHQSIQQVPLNINSPPIGNVNDSSSPPILPTKGLMSLRDVIAQSISQKFQQSPTPKEPSVGLKLPSPCIDSEYNSFKRGRFTPPLMGGVSVIKSQQDSQQNRSFSQPQKPQNTNVNNTPTGGKGTRPKRGKYRNYDRDSLVEAVRAVQRGEMSVHRAGSYYGVPHSTLEYKVKERHLMRPRKRDPKPSTTDDKIATVVKPQDPIRILPEKSKPPVLKPPQKYPPTSPNGIKMPLFDPTMAPIGYNPPPFPFWPHPSFHHVPIDFARNASTSSYPPHPEQLFATQMMQRLQEESSRTHPNVQNTISPATQTSGIPNSSLTKTAREMAESLYDGTGANGSFLDGIIRSSLEMGLPIGHKQIQQEEKNITPENMSNKALLDQLCRNSRLTPLPKTAVLDPQSSGDESSSYHSKRTQSPINFSRECKIGDSPLALNYTDGKSPARPDERYSNKRNSTDVVELSNDSNDSSHHHQMLDKKRKLSIDTHSEEERPSITSPSPPSRIYVKPQFQEITKPENLKPEALMRFILHDNLQEGGVEHTSDRNGVGEETIGDNESASVNPEAGQD